MNFGRDTLWRIIKNPNFLLFRFLTFFAHFMAYLSLKFAIFTKKTTYFFRKEAKNDQKKSKIKKVQN